MTTGQNIIDTRRDQALFNSLVNLKRGALSNEFTETQPDIESLKCSKAV